MVALLILVNFGCLDKKIIYVILEELNILILFNLVCLFYLKGRELQINIIMKSKPSHLKFRSVYRIRTEFNLHFE